MFVRKLQANETRVVTRMDREGETLIAMHVTVYFGKLPSEHEHIRIQNLFFALSELRKATDPGPLAR
jgi:hypothetical protein